VGGGLHDGNPGVRVLDLSPKEDMPYFTEVPARFAARSDALAAVPLYHIFGSEELSLLSKGIAQLAPEPYILLNNDEARGLGDQVTVQMNERSIELALRTSDVWPKGTAGLPVGLPEMGVVKFPVWIKISG